MPLVPEDHKAGAGWAVAGDPVYSVAPMYELADKVPGSNSSSAPRSMVRAVLYLD